MKMSFKSKPVIKTVVFVFCCALVATFFLLSKRFLPRAVCYNVSSASEDELIVKSQSADSLKDSISEISGDGPFVITILENGIYVTVSKTPVYKIKLSIFELTETDIQNLYEGIEITGKQNLLEIVSLMES